MRREDRVTVQGPVKKQQPDGMSHRGGCAIFVGKGFALLRRRFGRGLKLGHYGCTRCKSSVRRKCFPLVVKRWVGFSRFRPDPLENVHSQAFLKSTFPLALQALD